MEIVKSKMSEIREKDFFEVKEGQSLIISDPCYEIEDASSGEDAYSHKRKAKCGTWVFDFNKDTMTLDVYESKSANLIRKPGIKPHIFDEILHFSVDSGQVGVFLEESYQNDDLVKNIEFEERTFECLSNEPWYRACCEATVSGERMGFVPTGFVTSTKYGDGGYPVGIKYAEGTEEVAYIRIITEDICEYCHEEDCDCEICEECGYDVKDCTCEYCDECGCHENYCECEEDDNC